MWLQEDVFLRRVQKPQAANSKRKRGKKAAAVAEDAAWEEAKLLAAQLNIPSYELPAMVADDLGIDGINPEAEEPAEGSLLKWTTIYGYMSAIAELHGL
jgi:hypothetical protein